MTKLNEEIGTVGALLAAPQLATISNLRSLRGARPKVLAVFDFCGCGTAAKDSCVAGVGARHAVPAIPTPPTHPLYTGH